MQHLPVFLARLDGAFGHFATKLIAVDDKSASVEIRFPANGSGLVVYLENLVAGRTVAGPCAIEVKCFCRRRVIKRNRDAGDEPLGRRSQHLSPLFAVDKTGFAGARLSV